MSSLVSILTPTYNCGRYIHRLLDSVLKQTYPDIEMHVIDDGSTDDTKAVIESYIPKFEQRGYQLHYHYQANQGQSVAINNGLKMIHGDYLVWPDADDFYKTDDAIGILVDALRDTGDDVSMSRFLMEFLREDDLSFIRSIDHTPSYKEELFEDCLYAAHDFWYCSGGYMVKTALLKETIIRLQIYTEHDAGQNWQLMLPVLYGRRCITIPEVHYSVVMRVASHTRGQYSTRKQINKQLNGYRNTIISTVQRIPTMPDDQKQNYCSKINNKYNRMILKNNLSHYLWPLRTYLKQIKHKVLR